MFAYIKSREYLTNNNTWTQKNKEQKARKH